MQILAIIDVLHIDRLTAFGLLAVSLMLAFYWMEDQSHYFVLGFAIACLMGSTYGFLQGAWPFGWVEGIWSLVALRKWSRLSSSPVMQTVKPLEKVDAFLEDLLIVAKQSGPTTYMFGENDDTPRGFVQIHRPIPNRVLVHRLWAVTPGHGSGSHMLGTLCELADLHGIEIVLRPLPFGPPPHPMSVHDLREWYDRHGFRRSGKHMIREPQSASFIMPQLA